MNVFRYMLLSLLIVCVSAQTFRVCLNTGKTVKHYSVTDRDMPDEESGSSESTYKSSPEDPAIMQFADFMAIRGNESCLVQTSSGYALPGQTTQSYSFIPFVPPCVSFNNLHNC